MTHKWVNQINLHDAQADCDFSSPIQVILADDMLAVVEAARGLMNECKGMLGIAREGIKGCIGVTNVRCIEERIEQLQHALSQGEKGGSHAK